MKFLTFCLWIFQIQFVLGFHYIPRYLNEQFTPSANFCDNVSCKKKNHPFCNNGTYESKAEIIGTVPQLRFLDVEVKMEILRMQNMYRNIIACSNKTLMNFNKETLPNAGRMQELLWDIELEFIADSIARTCLMDLDFCPYTPNYPRAGKIINRMAYSSYISQIDAVENIIMDSFLSYINVPLDVIKKYEENQAIRRTLASITDTEMWELNEKAIDRDYILNIENILQMIRGKTEKVGCSLYGCGRKNGQYQFVFVCVYDKGNSVGEPVFKEDSDGGRLCKKKSPQYCCLCATPEPNNTVVDRTIKCEIARVDFDLAKFSNGSHEHLNVLAIFLNLILCFYKM